MTKDYLSPAGENSDDTTVYDSGRTRSGRHTRRQLLETMSIAGSITLAGCNQLKSNESNDIDGESQTKQTFRVPLDQNPAKTSFYAPWVSGDLLESSFAVTPKEKASESLQRILREPGVWVDKWWTGGDIYYTWLEKPIKVTPTEVTVTIRDDAKWSDDRAITGTDIAVNQLSLYLRNHFPPYYKMDEKKGPTHIWGAIDDFDVTDRSVTYRSSPGYFEQFWESSIRTQFGLWAPVAGSAVPTHIEPYGAFAEAVLQTARRAQQGKINPWKGANDPFVNPEDPHRRSLVKEHLAHDGKYVAKFSKPEHVVSTSAWDLVKINGPEAVFAPNPHHRNVENINFEMLILEHTPSDHRVRAALKGDRLDYAAPGPTPSSVVESLPNNITELRIPGGRGTGNELGLNFDYPGLGDRQVRVALMYILDQSIIARNIHQSVTKPVKTPGGDCWDATDYVSQAWIDKNLATYPTNQDRAASLMKEAGYTRDGDKWVDDDKKPFTLKLATHSETPRWEPTVASQLSEFGIETSVKKMDKSRFQNRLNNGDFPIWSHDGVSTNAAAQTLVFWIHVLINPTRYGVYPRKQYKTGDFSRNRIPSPLTEERWSEFTIKCPAIGQPNGPLQTYYPSALALAFFNNPPVDEFQRRVKTAMWLANWYLPTIPINQTFEQHFIDEAHWQWPTDSPSWKTFTSGGPRSTDEMFASGSIRANPDNSEDNEK